MPINPRSRGGHWSAQFIVDKPNPGSFHLDTSQTASVYAQLQAVIDRSEATLAQLEARAQAFAEQPLSRVLKGAGTLTDSTDHSLMAARSHINAVKALVNRDTSGIYESAKNYGNTDSEIAAKLGTIQAEAAHVQTPQVQTPTEHAPVVKERKNLG